MQTSNVDNPESVCVCVLSVCVCVCLACVCVSLTSDSLETVEFIIIRFSTVTASDMGIHHLLIMLTLTFIQGSYRVLEPWKTP